MIAARFDDAKFFKELQNIVQYSIGFTEGIQMGKRNMLNKLGVATVEMLKKYIDSQARVDHELLHHVYEWGMTGSPDARLFDINYTVSNLGLSFKSTFSQSRSIKEGSDVPFYDKARIMENGVPVKIIPTKKQALKFEINGEEVFSTGPVTVTNPGGTAAKGGFEQTFDSFFNNYFSQSFLKVSGITDYLNNPTIYKKNLTAGKKGGNSVGRTTGYRWITNVGVDI